MSSVAFAEAAALYDAVDAALGCADAIDGEGLSTAERVQLLARRQGWRRRLPAGEHELINQLVAYGTVEELGASVPRALADRLRISRAEARARIEQAADLGPRRGLDGQPLAAKLEHTAAA
ncbi:MAG: DUF222 domain-containing protein, partial [Mycobacteriaceae bacterium]|nr:DUF222 domain-containing protein [Mycobacteriaceae bacterium]